MVYPAHQLMTFRCSPASVRKVTRLYGRWAPGTPGTTPTGGSLLRRRPREDVAAGPHGRGGSVRSALS
ncbi:hypothetical protein GCM10023192_21570 [Amycolatopsis samaneae]